MIIAFEGVDCTFKESRSKELYNRLMELKEDREDFTTEIHYMSFPRYDKPIGKLIKSILNKDELTFFDRCKLVHLYALDRKEWMFEEYDSKALYILDRFSLSNIAYNMDLMNHSSIAAAIIEDLHLVCGDDIITYYFEKPEDDVLFDLLEDRAKKTGVKRDAYEDITFLSKVSDRYESLLKEFDSFNIVKVSNMDNSNPGGFIPRDALFDVVLTDDGNKIIIGVSDGKNIIRRTVLVLSCNEGDD